ncbi:unnamed protein product [Adineta steineri]|uniref:glycogenin glucosyltransferase n=1 Tax=Adineta steineri TaxID=433720 RepID=A0A815TIL3_9BILA|nr:unnamed protein product [Adineta steineri]CAF1503465.1 unnamed protein product [Adineta steineri]CAF3781704.1 unnamed protein product [Adineta steineri]
MILTRQLRAWVNNVLWKGLIIVLFVLVIALEKKINRISVRCRNQISVQNSESDTNREAIVSLYTGDKYLPGILVLGYTLNKYNVSNNRDMILLLPKGSLYDERHLAMLKTIGWKLMYVKRLSFPGKVLPQLVDGLVKLYAWNMTQYDAIVTLDADTMIVGSIEEPFQQMRINSTIQMLAVDDPGVSPSDRKGLRSYFNGGVLFFRPNSTHFNELVHLSANKSYYGLKYPQQNLLNKYFRDRWIPLSPIFNMLDLFNGQHHMWNNRLKNLHIIHFAGSQKPWNVIRRIRKKQLDTDIIWRRCFATLITENGWREDDFLVPLASQSFRINLRYDRWIKAI